MFQDQTLNFMGRAAMRLEKKDYEDASQDQRLAFLGQIAFDGVDASRIIYSLRKPASSLKTLGQEKYDEELMKWYQFLKNTAEKWVMMLNKMRSFFGELGQILQNKAKTLLMVNTFCQQNNQMQAQLLKIIEGQIADLKLKKFIEEEKK